MNFNWLFLLMVSILCLSGCAEKRTVYRIETRTHSQSFDPLLVSEFQICSIDFVSCNKDIKVSMGTDDHIYITSKSGNSAEASFIMYRGQIVQLNAPSPTIQSDLIEKVIFLLLGFLLAFLTTLLNITVTSRMELRKRRHKVLQIIGAKRVMDAKHWQTKLEKYSDWILDTDAFILDIISAYKSMRADTPIRKRSSELRKVVSKHIVS